MGCHDQWPGVRPPPHHGQPVAGVVVLLVCVAASAATSCNRPSPVAATASRSPAAVLAAPAAANVTLTGRIIEAPPTSSTGVWDATVTLDDGVNRWQSAKTTGGVGRGEYTISGLHAGQFRATIAADGFVSVTEDITVGSDSTNDFRLLPVPVTKSITLSDRLGDHDGTCSDGVQPKPCHIIAVPVHNPGSIEATLTWQGATQAVLNLLLFEKDGRAPLIQSTQVDGARQEMASAVPGGAVYEIRIIYASGAGTAAYSLRVSYPN
jgi:hypothetical protein